MFKPFSQADKSIQTKYGGTGLGLWISNKLVDLMRGKISIVSELNKGTVFIIDIPTFSEIQSSEEIISDNDGSHKSKTTDILLFQQDEMMKNLFKKYL